MMMFISKWVRRSNASTGAEWLVTRFGTSGKGVKSSHNVVVAFALLSCFGFLAYGFVGLGKFIEIFVPWHLVSALRTFYSSTGVRAAFVWDRIYVVCHVLFHLGRYAQHCAGRCNKVCDHDPLPAFPLQ